MRAIERGCGVSDVARINPGAKGHPVKVKARALQLVEAGWVPRRASMLLAREGVLVAPSTIARWSKPNERHKRAERARKRRSARAKTGRRTITRVSDDWKLERIRELAARGVKPRAIGQVAAVWWGEELSEHQVRRLLGLANERSAA